PAAVPIPRPARAQSRKNAVRDAPRILVMHNSGCVPLFPRAVRVHSRILPEVSPNTLSGVETVEYLRNTGLRLRNHEELGVIDQRLDLGELSAYQVALCLIDLV